MTAIAMQTNPGLRLNWPRIGALSGSLSLHAYALVLLLAPPVALQIMTHVEPAPVVVELHQVKPEEKKPEPVLPAPPTKPVHHAPTPIVHPTETSPIQVPVVDAKPDIGPIDLGPSKPAVDSGAIDVAPTAMAYGASTKVQYPLASARARQGAAARTGRRGRRAADRGNRAFERLRAARHRGARCGPALEVPARYAQRRRAKQIGR